MSAVKEKIETFLKSEYNIDNFTELAKEIFPNLEIIAPYKFNKEFSNFNYHIAGSTNVGRYKDADNKTIIIMAVELSKAAAVENARSTQRSYAKKLIENANADAAFIAFYTEGVGKWRISFVRLDYEINFEHGSLKTDTKITPAKRYSYLVGVDEPCHTAISRFGEFLSDDISKPCCPTLDSLEDAFSVEKVTDEFFKLYCEKYHQLREELEKNSDFIIESQQHNFTTEQFAKKLLGQIVFLYFLQKKGWLGVNAWPRTLSVKEYKRAFYAKGNKSRNLIPKLYKAAQNGQYVIDSRELLLINDEDEAVLAGCVKGEPWGSGPHNFMRKLFDFAIKKEKNFFDDFLEPLFYDALNQNRGEQGYCAALHCRIPFLSGGLFEPIDGYDWKHNDFQIPNYVFSNEQEKGRDADGILDIFDRYNFTMSEDEPMEREVAIDPEMLGKVFENLLEISDRKSKGAFYTPREIVHYMCQETLIDYLTQKLQVDEKDIRDFILYGDLMKDEDTVKEKRQGNGGMYIAESLFKVDNSGNIIVNRLVELDEALQQVRIADPAVGSGAFSLGMLNEIVRARQNITAYLAINKNKYDKRMFYQIDRSVHTLKIETVKNCIYAVDIEPSAVDIAQLRLWLSMVIDDEITPDAQSELDGHKNPLLLPNLECNILCGNSLLEEFEGIKLINESDLLGNTSNNAQVNLNQGIYESILRKLIKTQDELFRCKNTEEKKELKNQIVSLRDMIIKNQLEGCSKDTFEKYEESKKLASKPYILWQLDFARVFREKGGFDIVIGNPPYGAKFSTEQKNIFKKEYITAQTIKNIQKGSMDSYTLFIELAFNLTAKKGVLSYIVPLSFTSSDSLSGVHKLIFDNCKSLIVSSYAVRPQPVFENAVVNTSIFKAVKSIGHCDIYTTKLNRKRKKFNLSVLIKNLQFIKVNENILFGRIPKIGTIIEKDILMKIMKFPRLKNFIRKSGSPIFYRFAGGRYFKVITNYSNGSSAERKIFFDSYISDAIGCILSSTLSFWFYQIYSDNLNWKNFEVESFPIPCLNDTDIEYLKSLYMNYLSDIEHNANVRVSSGASSYNVSQFKEYKIVKSKKIIDKIDDYIGPLYGLSDEEINFIKNYEIDVRLGDES